jgi:ABC-type sugar transport system substrate-binding protein
MVVWRQDVPEKEPGEEMSNKVRSAGPCLLAVMVVAAIGGCGGSTEGSATTSASAGASDGARKDVKVTLVMPSLENGYYTEAVDKVKAAAAADGHVDLDVVAGTDTTNVNQMISNLKTASLKKPDAILILPNDAKAFAKPLEAASKTSKIVNAGIVVDGFTPTSTVLFPDKVGGEAAGKWMAAHLPDGAKIGILHCNPGYPNLQARVDGAESAWTNKKFDVVATLDAKCDNARGRSVMADMLTAHPDLDAVFSISDSQSIGALGAIKTAGKKITFVSYDAQPTGVAKIRDGQMAADVDTNVGAGMTKAAELTFSAARDESVPTTYNVPPRVVDKSNVDQLFPQ